MTLLYSYLRQYWRLIALALILATINQVFSLLDPLIFRHVIDEYATRFQEYSTGEFFRGVTLGRLQKVRSDVEKLIATSINVLFTSMVGIIFVMTYAFTVHWVIAPVYFL